jgi:molybdenum cofactor synthesis domain-containing protein
MSPTIEVLSVNLSERTGTVKTPVDAAEIDELGVVGDAHAGRWHRQVSLLDEASARRLSEQTGRQILPGQFGENLTVRGMPCGDVAVLDRFRFERVELEVTQIGKECHGAGCAIFQTVGECVMPSEGVFSRVVHGGTIRRGEHGQHLPRTLRCLVVTLSDRAAAGEYQDRSGPRIRQLLEGFLIEHRWHAEIETALLPDDAELLRSRLTTALAAGVDVILTTGGTGVGPRDVTPETVAPLCEKLLPGIMEHIRLKYGASSPNALLSRGIAGVAGRTQLYTLPGSVRAVEQYVGEILKTLEHLVLMLHGLDVHSGK